MSSFFQSWSFLVVGPRIMEEDRVIIVPKGGPVCFNIPSRTDISKVILKICNKLICSSDKFQIAGVESLC